MIRKILRRGWIVLLSMLLLSLAAGAMGSRSETSYTATSVLLVDSGAGREGPGQAHEALQLARTYAQLVPRDEAILDGVARRMQSNRNEASSRVTASTVGDTSLLQLSYTASEHDVAVAGARAIAEATMADSNGTIARGALRQVRLADPQATETGGIGRTTTPVGLLLGLALGVVLAVAWERSDRRIDHVDELSAVIGQPATDMAALTPASVDATAARWGALAGTFSPVVALVSAVPGHTDAARDVALRIASLLRSAGRPISVYVGALPEDREYAELAIVVAGAPGAEGGEASALGSDLVALNVPRGSSQSKVIESAEALAKYGHQVQWGVLTAQTRRLPRGLRARGVGSTSVPTGRQGAPQESPQETNVQASVVGSRHPDADTPGPDPTRAWSSSQERREA